MRVHDQNPPRRPPIWVASGRPDDVADAFCHVDIDDGAIARARRIRVLPTTSPVLIVHYRAPMVSQRGSYKRTVNGMHSHAASLTPSGPLGVVLVRLKADVADRVLGVRPAELLDASVDLASIFGASATALIEEQLAEADGAAARLACMRDFLRERTGPGRLDPVVAEAMRTIGRNPAISIDRLAEHVDVGRRNLQRRFKSETGTSAKHFARIARMQRAVSARRAGAGWAEVAHAAGFTDQAHLIRDFRALAGAPPDAFCRTATAPAVQVWNDRLASQFYNTFVD
jgi:AraC-like DNA-binding protein